MSSHNDRIARIRAAYETARARDAVVRSLPALAVVVAAALFLGGDLVRLMTALGVSVAVWLFLWRGQALGAGTFPGVAAGLVPLTTATVMGATGHGCTVGGCCGECSTACVVACSCAGAASGLALAFVLRRQPSSALAGAVVAVGVGMIGCAPLGFSSAFGMAAGALLAVLAGSAATRLVRFAA